MTKGTVLVIGSNATRIEVQDGGWRPIGHYLNEITVPVLALLDADYDIVLASPDGTKPHIDAVSDSAEHFGGDAAAHQRARSFFEQSPKMNDVRSLRSVIDDGLDAYAGVFVPGGHAPAVDLMQDADTGVILRHFHEAAKPTALLCHAPVSLVAALPRARELRAALVSGDQARASEWAGGWPYAGYTMTVFSGSEEKTAEATLLHGQLYFDMPEALRAAGGQVVTNTADLEPNVVVDRELITGQNPRSDHQIAAKLVEMLTT